MKDRSFYISWILANGWAEAIGLGSTFLLGTQLSLGDGEYTRPSEVIILALAAILLGTVLEGVVVGFAQGRVLHRRIPGIQLKTWVLATAAGAGLAWLIGMIPSTVMSLSQPTPAVVAAEEPDAVIQYLLAAGLGLVAGPILGCAQWVVLRRHVPKSGLWLWANGIAWAAGMPVLFVGMNFVPWDASVASIALPIYVTCLAAGVVVGLIHGAFLLRMTSINELAQSI